MEKTSEQFFPAAPRRRARRLPRILEAFAWIGFFAFALTFLALRYWLLPQVEQYRGEIAGALSRTIGLPVKIGRIEASWWWLRPRLSIADLRIHDREGKEVLALPSVDTVLAWHSLLYGGLHLHSLVIERPRLTVRRDAEGRLYVAGIGLAGGAGDGRGSAWFAAQREIAIHDAEIEWRDEQRGAPPLILSAVNLRMSNEEGAHAIGLSARPPAGLGARLDLRIAFDDRGIAQPGGWGGKAYVELGESDLAAWGTWLDYPVEVQAGRGALRLWANFENSALRRVTADIEVADARLRVAPDLPQLEIARLGGRLLGRKLGRGYELAGKDLVLALHDGTTLRQNRLGLQWERAADGGIAQAKLSAALIEIVPLMSLARYAPLPAGSRERLDSLNLQGRLLDVQFDWRGEPAATPHFAAKARFEGLGMQASDRLPGFSGLSGALDFDEARGAISVAGSAVAIELPRVFPEPIGFDALDAKLGWEAAGDAGISIRVASLSFANAQLSGSASGSYAWDASGPGEIDLTAQLARVDGGRIGGYLPHASIMGEATRQWLAGAIVAAPLSDVHLRIKGNLRNFPFRDTAQGEFRVAAKLAAGVLDFASGWPRIEGIEGDVLFERGALQILAARAATQGARLLGVRAAIPDLLSRAPRLELTGQAEGATQQFLDYIRASPVRAMVGGATDGMHASGDGRLQLRLDLPLATLSASKVSGEYRFVDNSLTLLPEFPPISRAAGRLSFSDAGFTLHEAKGRLFGGAVAASGATRPRRGLRIEFDGDATARGLRALLPSGMRERLAGGFLYSGNLIARDGTLHVTIKSLFDGLASELPEPLAKLAEEKLPTRVSIVQRKARTSAQLSLGSRLAASAQLRPARGGIELHRAAVALGAAASRAALRMPKAGLLVYGTLDRLDLDRWRAALPARDASAPDMPLRVDKLEIAQLDAFGKRLHNLRIEAGPTRGGMEIRFGAADPARTTDVKGTLHYVKGKPAQLKGDFETLRIPGDTPGAPKSAEPMTELPDIDLAVGQFEVAGREMGRIKMRARNDGPDWRIESLSVDNPDGGVTGSGAWHGGEFPATSVKFEIKALDSGKLLARMGFPGLLRGGRATLSGTLGWTGEPAGLDFPSLSGELKLDATSGQFIKVDPGAGKLVSLLSLQALPRRLTGDFGDVFQSGFQYQTLSSDLRVLQGVARTDNLHISGSAAEVSMTGWVDLAREAQDLRVRVVP
ncbi:MAG: YhdP family protein, partial [Betaproteobacteria bacterium]|nr:YhdP family protein [Betaproteobacteria bacterium]